MIAIDTHVLVRLVVADDAGLDFADALHLAATPKAEGLFTFDRRLARSMEDAVSLVPE